MGCDVDIRMTKFVLRAHEFDFLRPRQIAKIDEATLSERGDEAERKFVFGVIGGRKLRRFAIWILPPCASKGMVENLTAAVHHAELCAVKRKNVAWFYDDAFVFSRGEKFLI